MRGRRVKRGTYTGTGAALNVEVGFEPDYLVIWNETDGDVRGEYINGMTADHAFKIVDSGAGTTDLSKATSNGITLTSNGFKVGTDSALNENAKSYRWVAF
jgi:hypothetical protein